MKLCLVFGILSFALSADAGASMHNPHYCFALDRTRPQGNMHAAITSYDSIRRIDFSTVNPFPSLKSRTASRFWYMAKYGIRLPHPLTPQRMIDFAQSSIIPDIVRNYEAGLTTLCQQDYENLRNFTIESDFLEENAALVRPSGILELQNSVQRFQQAFPDVLPRQYSSNQYRFRHINIERSNQSVRAFASGLFGETGAGSVVYEPIPQVDWLLNPFGNCPLYTAELAARADYEGSTFRNGPEVQQLVREINEKLGFRGRNEIDIATIDTMWQWCRFQISNTFSTGVNAPWCAAFSIAHQQILEYLEDLQFYYRHGYGFRNRRLQENLTCGILQDLVTLMRSNNDTERTAHIYSSFLGEIQSTLVALGAFRDVWALTEFNFAQQANRQWLSSLFTAFGSGIAVVRYDSEDGDHDLVFLINEKPLWLPGCNPQTGICKLSFIEDRFDRFINANCSQIFCSND